MCTIVDLPSCSWGRAKKSGCHYNQWIDSVTYERYRFVKLTFGLLKSPIHFLEPVRGNYGEIPDWGKIVFGQSYIYKELFSEDFWWKISNLHRKFPISTRKSQNVSITGMPSQLKYPQRSRWHMHMVNDRPNHLKNATNTTNIVHIQRERCSKPWKFIHTYSAIKLAKKISYHTVKSPLKLLVSFLYDKWLIILRLNFFVKSMLFSLLLIVYFRRQLHVNKN